MPAEVFFAPIADPGTLTLAQLATELSRARLTAKITEDKVEQLWIEFDGFKSRLLIGKEEPLGLIMLQVYGDLSSETPLIEKVEALLQAHGYVDAEQFSG